MAGQESINSNENIIRKAEVMDVPIIQELLKKNLFKNLNEDERKDGYFFYEPTDEELIKIINDTGIYLSLSGDELKGYFMTMSKELAKTIPFEAEMLDHAEEMIFNNEQIKDYKYFVMAQLCVAKEYRGGTTFHKLHLNTRSAMKDRGFEIGVGEIEDGNELSLAVHRNLTDVGTYKASSGLKWHIMVADLSKD